LVILERFRPKKEGFALHCKLKINKHIIEVYEYDKLNSSPMVLTDDRSEYGQSEDAAYNYSQTIKRRRKFVFDLAIANFDCESSKFLTLSFAQNMTDLKQSNKEFQKFLRKLKKELKIEIKYLAVIEFQKRGAIHYHMLINMPYVPVKWLQRLWVHGSLKINKIKHVDNLGAYITKYMSKDNADERLKAVKGYNCSQGLERPKIIKSWRGDEILIKALINQYDLKKEKAEFVHTVNTQDYGSISYLQFNLKRMKGGSQYQKNDNNNIRGNRGRFAYKNVG
jgi:hypothetical protein